MAKIDTRHIGLDIGLYFIRMITGREHLHYGYWPAGLEVCFANLGRAQDFYSEKLFTFLPPPPAKILDIGGGAGVTAARLEKTGYQVEMVVPSALLAERARENTQGRVKIHLMPFESFNNSEKFDICLFSESFQYIPLDIALSKSSSLLKPGGMIVIGDCFRNQAFSELVSQQSHIRPENIIADGHRFDLMLEEIDRQGLAITRNENITDFVAPSTGLYGDVYQLVGYSVKRIDEALHENRPLMRRILALLIKIFVSKKRQRRLVDRLWGDKGYNAENFKKYNEYFILRLESKKLSEGPGQIKR